MAIKTTNFSIEKNKFLTDNEAFNQGLNPVSRLFRWTVQTSKATQDWYSLAKTVRDVFDWACETARYKNYSEAFSWAQSCHGVCAQTTKATIIPYLLGSVDNLLFKRGKTGPAIGKQLLHLVLSVNLVARVTLGMAAFSTPLNCVLLIHYTVDLGTQLYRWNQMRSVSLNDVEKKDTISDDDLNRVMDQERTMQKLRVIDAVVSLAAEVFSQMYPAMKLVNATAGAATALYSTGISCYRDMQFEWHFKMK